MPNEDKKIEELDKEFAIKLENMEQINFKDGRQFFKLHDPKSDTYIMIENLNRSQNMSEQFKEIQNTLMSAQTKNGGINAREIYQSEAKYTRNVLMLVPINESMQYLYKLDNMDKKKKQVLITLIKNSENLYLRFINFENGFAIDRNGKVINGKYNDSTNKVELDVADTLRFDADKVTSLNTDYEDIDLSNVDFDKLAEEIEISDDMPMEIAGEKIDPKYVKQVNDYPELMERDQRMTNKQRTIIAHILAAMKQRQLKKQNSLEKQKVYVLNNGNKNQAAFVNKMLLALLSGVVIGLFLTLFITYFRV